MYKFLKIAGIAPLLLILFRGPVFRFFIAYNDHGSRLEIKVKNQTLKDQILKLSEGQTVTLKLIDKIANEITSSNLTFTTEQAANDPNVLIRTKLANCVGYSAMYNAVANQLIRQHNMEQEITATHKIGKLEILGFDIHQWFDSPFFKDHDYNVLEHLSTHEKIASDPTVNDYLGIDRIKQNN